MRLLMLKLLSSQPFLDFFRILLDALSNGRVILGIGAGWNAEEMEDHGVPFRKRWRVTGERVKAIIRIWTQDAAEFHGETVNFDPI